MQLFPAVSLSFFQEVVQPMQIPAPSEHEAAHFENIPRNKGFRSLPLVWKFVEKALISMGGHEQVVRWQPTYLSQEALREYIGFMLIAPGT